jgi:hypothetical protein
VYPMAERRHFKVPFFERGRRMHGRTPNRLKLLDAAVPCGGHLSPFRAGFGLRHSASIPPAIPKSIPLPQVMR